MQTRTVARFEPWAQYILFTILVIATPFVVVTRFLQGAVYNVSHTYYYIWGLKLPYVGVTAVLVIIALGIWQFRHLNRRRVKALLAIVGLIAFAQWLQDLYGGMSVYDLQKNWHYVAFASYSFIFFRAFSRIKMPVNRMILYAFVSGVCLSVIDETFQLHMSNRVFDISDQAKDALGVILGLILVLFVSETYGTIPMNPKSWWKSSLKGYLDDPATTLILCGLLALSAIVVSPVLTDYVYLKYCLFLIFLLFAFVVLVLHFLQYRKFRLVFLPLAGVVLLTLSGSFAMNSSKLISHSSNGLTIYKGLPVPYLDMLIYPDGLPRLVDKKHFFNQQDKQFLMRQKPDILIIGSGFSGLGGRGFPVSNGTAFMFNRFTLEGMQVMVLPTPKACEVFNRVKRDGKKVMLVIHTTC